MTRTLRTALTSLLLLAAFAPSALANSNYRSVIERITPPAPGLQLQVLGFDQNFLLINKTGKEVTVRGYESEPYARLLPDGTVQENLNSPATYLNSDRYGRATVPATAGANRQPQWKTLDKTGRLTWHDHRMHWMGSGSTAPPSVKDPLKRTKVFSYTIPLDVGATPTKVEGTLFWVGPPGGGMPVGAVVVLILLLIGALLLVIVVRRRRATDSSLKSRDEAW